MEEINRHGIKIRDQEVICLDLSHLEDEPGQEVYGLIGFEMFRDYDLIFNYEE